MKNVAKRLENAIIDAKSPDGKILKYSGGRFSYGIGKDAASADTALRASKEVRERTGERAGRGVKPVGLVEVAEGQRMGETGDKAVSNIPAREVIPPIRKMEVDANVQATLFKGEDAAGYEGVSPAEGGEKGVEAAESETGKEVGGAATADTGQYAKTERQAIELPEITELANELMEGKFPYIKRKLRVMKGTAAGVFHSKTGKIGLRADIFKDVHEAARVMAHEIGHLVDWLPDRYIQRGNLLGRIATLQKYMQLYQTNACLQTTT